MDLNYKDVNLKVGLEIHQQLDTPAKLFCNCKPELFKDDPTIKFDRRLRPTQSELGQIDPAAYFEFQKGLKIIYEANTDSSCLVEMDEEPPHIMNSQAVNLALIISLMLKAKIMDEIHVMRKTVIDGSNTTGFQRTCIIGLNGQLIVRDKIIPIQQVSLEEDAARRMGKKGNLSCYRIDRLGVPLLEITTAPVIKSPEETKEVALAIGTLLRATGKMKRGIGTIRQDLNISIDKGALVEIKGVQDLEILHTAVKYEVQRQFTLIQIRQELKLRGAKPEEIIDEFFDITQIFENTKCEILCKALEKDHQIFAVKIPKFKGLLKKELIPNIRLGTEIADRARFWGRVGGIFHTDELPAYGISNEEIEKINKIIKTKEFDAVVFVADEKEKVFEALKAVVKRSKEALQSVPEETRKANPDGTSRYMRPRPGAARMYPETDVPSIQITKEDIKQIQLKLPELPDKKFLRLLKDYKLNKKLAKQILDSRYGELFEWISNETKVMPKIIASFLTETLKALKREGLKIEKISENQFKQIFSALSDGKLTKESLPEIVTWLTKNRKKTIQEAINCLGLEILSKPDLERIIKEIIESNQKLITERKMVAFGSLMSVAMKQLRGKAKADQVAKLLKIYLEEEIKFIRKKKE